MTHPAAWFEAHTADAPDPLRVRMREMAGVAPDAMALARAAARALDEVVAHPGDRSIALDLLAADGLITLALFRQAEADPAGLEAFARQLTTETGR